MRGQRLMSQWLALICVALALMACGTGRVASAVEPAGPKYTVTSNLMQKPGQEAVVCSFTPLPEPPIGCGGPSVANLDLATMSDAHRYSDGVVEVGTYRLVGTWEGGSLHLTETPVAANPSAHTPTPGCAQTTADPSPDATPEGRKLMDEEELIQQHGIVLLEFMCQGALFVVVAVADADTIDFMTNRYAPVKVAGWLQLLG